MKFSSISPFLGSSYKMTNENVRFLVIFGGGFQRFVIKKWFFVLAKLSD